LRRQLLEMSAHQFRMLKIERTRVRLLLRDANLRKEINQDFRLDLEFSGQLVDSYLIWI